MQIQITDGVPLRLAVRCRRRRRRRSHTRHLLERVSGGVTDTFDLTSFFLYSTRTTQSRLSGLAMRVYVQISFISDYCHPRASLNRFLSHLAVWRCRRWGETREYVLDLGRPSCRRATHLAPLPDGSD